MSEYFKQTWNLVNEYFYSNQIDPSKLVDHELVRAYLKACQKSTPKGVSISRKGNRLYLRFKTPNNSATTDNSCNESFTRDGCINALAKALAVFDKLKETDSESEYWEWYESEIKGIQILIDDCLTIGQAVEIVRKNYLSGYDKCGRDRSSEKLKTNTLAGYYDAYGQYHSKLNPNLKLNGDNFIAEIKRIWGQLFTVSGTQTICSRGFKNAYTSCCKLFRDTKHDKGLKNVQSYFGTIKVIQKNKEQTVDLETFLDFRSRVLGLSGYKLTKTQYRHIESRKSWMKAICFNLIYGFRASEFKAILNLDETIKRGDRVFLALHDPTNDENIVVIDDGFWVTDTSGKRHYITVKTGNRIARPMIHPDYPNLIELLGIKDSGVKMPECIPEANSHPDTMKDIYHNRMRQKLSRFASQVGGQGFTQTHALRHLANYHGKLAGLTREQRALSLGHSQTMNDKYDKHQTTRNQVNLLMADISEKSEIQRLKDELSQAQETIKSLE
ncbi:hypothetical protein PN466_09550, partial [Roseofilum reptotaenium CS-1145]